jgi:hypothetical protein
MSEYNDPKIYGNLKHAYCIPQNTKLTVIGIPED